MRTIKSSSRFAREFKRLEAGEHGKTIRNELATTLNLLVNDEPLPPKYSDHPLSGAWRGFRDCHIRPDIVLIYRKVGLEQLELARIGSHSNLFKD